MQTAINILLGTCIYFLIAYSFSITFKVVKFFNLMHGAFLTLGAYFVFQLTSLSLPLVFAIPIAILFGVFLMLIINQLFFQPLLKKKIESWQLLVASLGGYIVLQNMISLIWKDKVETFRTWEVTVGRPIFGANITDVEIIIILASVVLLLLSMLFLKTNIIGQKIIAVSSNMTLSTILGISKEKVIMWCFALGTGLVCSAGILIAADIDMKPKMGFNWLLYGIIAMIVGGLGKKRYLLFGAFLLACVQYIPAYYMDDTKWKEAFSYLILIIILYFKPYGLSGQKLNKVEV